MGTLEERRINLLAEIASKVYLEEYEEADKMCDYYRLLFGNLPGETNGLVAKSKKEK